MRVVIDNQALAEHELAYRRYHGLSLEIIPIVCTGPDPQPDYGPYKERTAYTKVKYWVPPGFKIIED